MLKQLGMIIVSYVPLKILLYLFKYAFIVRISKLFELGNVCCLRRIGVPGSKTRVIHSAEIVGSGAIHEVLVKSML